MTKHAIDDVVNDSIKFEFEGRIYYARNFYDADMDGGVELYDEYGKLLGEAIGYSISDEVDINNEEELEIQENEIADLQDFIMTDPDTFLY